MEHDEELIAKLWLEEHASPTIISSSSSKNAHRKIKCKLNKKQLQTIQLFCKKNRVTWDVFIHTAWGILLNRLSTTEITIFGTGPTSATRIQCVKSIIQPQTTVARALKQMQAQRKKKNSATASSLGQAVRYLLFLHNKKGIAALSKKWQTYPLWLIVDKNLSSTLNLFYSPASFTKKNSERIIEHLKLIMQEMCQHKSQKVSELTILTAQEKKKIISQWARPVYDFTIPLLKATSHELFSAQAKKTPDATAITYDDKTITYLILEKAAHQLATILLQKNVKVGDRIHILMERTPTLIMAMLAVFKVGAIFIPINLKYPSERIEFIINDTQSIYILSNDVAHLAEKHHAKVIIIPAEWEALAEALSSSSSSTVAANKSTLPVVNPEDIAYIIYTSGTTGTPKGVMIRHKSLTNLTAWYQGCFNITAQDRASQFASQGFDPFFCETIPFLATGASVHIVDDQTKLSPALFMTWLEKNKITICDLPTAYAHLLFSMSWPQKMHLKIAKVGGENMGHYPHDQLPFDVWNIYGPTEATVEATFNKIHDAHKICVKHHTPPIGKPMANSEAYVVDKQLQLLPFGVAGELLLGGDNISVGYFNRDELTQEKFIPHILDKKNKNKLYRTGDLVRWLADGNLEFVGRRDHQIKIRGYRIELGDIETAIRHHPDVHEVTVLVKENINGEKSLVAYVVPNLDRGRFLYQERCLLSLNENTIFETITEDISKHGVALTGITEALEPGQAVQLHLKLPGLAEGKTFPGRVIWYQDNRCGIIFELGEEHRSMLHKSIDYYLATHNVMELVLSSAAKRNLKKALRKKLPDYMIPSTFVTLMQMPLTFSGKVDTKALPPPQEFERILQKNYVAPISATEKRLAAIWCDLLKQPKVSMSDNFFDLGGNSITAAALAINILREFNISLPTKLLFDLPYISILAEYIDTKGEKYTTQSLVQEEIERDAKLHENILPTKKLSPHLKNVQNILLTGAGGFLGIYLLRELLTTTNAKVYCLIRRGEFDTAAKRLLSTIQKFKLEDDISLSNRRIIAIPGDISFDHFGLPLEQYNNLLEKIDLIYHCGAQVNIMAAYHKLRGSNVQGTLEIIKFATRKVDKPIHYVSTLSAACRKDRDGRLAEDFPDDQYDTLFGGYAISKWISERLLTEIKNRGLPITIYRSGYISGQSNNGMTNTNDALLLLIKGCIQLGYAPEMNEKITILPVDFVSKAIVGISLNYPDKAAIYHLDHPVGIEWRDLIAWVNEYGYKVNMMPLKEWQTKLVDIANTNALFPFLPHYLAMKDEPFVEVATEKTMNVLNKLKLTCPEISKNLLSIYFDYLNQIQFLPQV